MCLILQNGFEKIINEFTSTISNFHFHETKTLKQQIEQKNAEITKLQFTFNTTIQQLKETVSILKTSNEDLKSKLQEKERLLEKLRNNSEFEEGESFEICEEETSPDSKLRQKRSYSELPKKVYLIIYICIVSSQYLLFRIMLKLPKHFQ